MRQNEITFVLTGALSPDGEIAEHVHRHGDGVHDIAFAVDDVRSAWRETTSRGARSYLEYAEAGSDEDGTSVAAPSTPTERSSTRSSTGATTTVHSLRASA